MNSNRKKNELIFKTGERDNRIGNDPAEALQNDLVLLVK